VCFAALLWRNKPQAQLAAGIHACFIHDLQMVEKKVTSTLMNVGDCTAEHARMQEQGGGAGVMNLR
jgi:hypothetical protein